jgi:hypothetical protein
MKKLLLLCLMGLIIAVLALSACTIKTPSLTTTGTSVEAFVFPDHGNIRINGEGYFMFMRSDQVGENTSFEGVDFTPHQEQPGVTSTGPISYKIDVRFADRTVEVLQYVGLGNENNIDINLAKHENPKAGIMLAWHDVKGGLSRVLYLLVSEQ